MGLNHTMSLQFVLEGNVRARKMSRLKMYLRKEGASISFDRSVEARRLNRGFEFLR